MKVVVLALAAFLAGACTGERAQPAIGFTYNWGDERFAQFLRDEIARTRPEGAPEIRLITADSGGWRASAATALTAEVRRAHTLAEDPNVVVAIGPGGSREAILVSPIYRDARLMDLVPTATSRLLTPFAEWSPVLAPNDSLQGDFIGAFADSALGAKRVAIFYVPDEYGVGLATGTETALNGRGARVILRTPIRLTLDCSVLPDSFYTSVVDQLDARGGADAVVAAARTVEAGCLTAALRRRWPRLPIIAGDGTLPIDDFFRRAGGRSDGVYVVAFWHPDFSPETSVDFVSRFERAVARPLRHADAVFYDATMLAVAAIREEGASRDAVRRYLRSLNVTRPPYAGLTGPIAFTPGFPRPVLMTRVDGRSTVIVAGR